jgi:hypothetical protein
MRIDLGFCPLTLPRRAAGPPILPDCANQAVKHLCLRQLFPQRWVAATLTEPETV